MVLWLLAAHAAPELGRQRSGENTFGQVGAVHVLIELLAALRVGSVSFYDSTMLSSFWRWVSKFVLVARK